MDNNFVILKQTLRANWFALCIFTQIAVVMGTYLIAYY